MNICIIGCGSIGALKEDRFDNPYSKNILTHAHALYHFRKKGIIDNFYLIDNNKEKLKIACDKWKCRGFKNLKELNIDIDIFVIAIDTENHFNILNEILELKLNPKMIICEKPFCNNYDEAFKINNRYYNRNIPIVINYTRRFCTQLQSLKQKLQKEKINSCNIIYIRGFKRDACHAIDLCNYFFGEFKQGKILGNIQNTFNDYSNYDLTVPAWMEFEKCKNVYLTPANGKDYSIFEFDILTRNGRCAIIDHSKKIKIYNKEPEKIYGDFNSIGYNSVEDITVELENALLILHGNCINYLKENNKNYDLFSTGYDALKTQKIISSLLRE